MMQHLGTNTLIDYLHGELAPGEDATVLAHLEGCAACTRELNVEAGITDALRAAARAEALELPLGMSSAIMARIAASSQSPLGRLQGWLRPVVLVPLAAAVTAAAIFFPLNAHKTVPPRALPVSYYLEEHAARAQENPLADRSAAVMITSLERTASAGSVPPVQSVNAALTAADDGAR